MPKMEEISCNKINCPVGVIGSFDAAKEFVESKHLPDDETMILDAKSNIEDIKQLRIFLMNRGFNRRVGIIYGLNKWKDSQQAVLLKIFEQLPEFNCVYYTASYMPSMVIKTRSEIWHVKSGKNVMLYELGKMLLNAMKDGSYTKEMMDGFKIAVQVQSWVDDGVIGQKEQSIILKSLGI